MYARVDLVASNVRRTATADQSALRRGCAWGLCNGSGGAAHGKLVTKVTPAPRREDDSGRASFATCRSRSPRRAAAQARSRSRSVTTRRTRSSPHDQARTLIHGWMCEQRPSRRDFARGSHRGDPPGHPARVVERPRGASQATRRSVPSAWNAPGHTTRATPTTSSAKGT